MKDMLLLALRYIKVQRKHSIFIIISVILSVALTMFSISVVFTYRETKRLAAIEQNGSYHVLMSGLDKDKAELLSHNAAFSQAEIFKMNTFPDSESRQYIDENGINNFYSYDYLIVGADNDIMSEFGSDDLEIIDVQQAFSSGGTELLPKMLLAEGHMPEDASQIAIPEERGYKVGDKIKLVKAIMTYDYFESYFIPIETKEKVYTVCGLLSTGETFAENIYVSEEDTFPFTGGFTCTYGIRARFADMNAHFFSTLLDICEKADIKVGQREGILISGGNEFGYSFNHELIDAEAAGKEARAKLIEISAILYVVIMLILAGGRMIIDCEFELTAEKKRRHMGLMMSIGADDRQLVAVTTFEGIILGLIAVPLGLILGYLIIIAVCMIVSSDSELMNSLCLDSIKPVISIWYLVIASITGIGWVFFSAYGTAVRIKKVNPVEAVNGYRKSQKLPFPKKPYKHRDDPKRFLGSITYSTMHMEKKRFVSCTASVALSMFLFVLLSYSPVIYENYLNIVFEELHGYNDDFTIRGEMNGYDYYELKDRLFESGYFEEQSVPPLYVYFDAIKGTFTADGRNTEYRFKTEYVGSEKDNVTVSGYSLSNSDLPVAVIFDRISGIENGSILTAQPKRFTSISAEGMPEFEFMVIIPDEEPAHLQNGFIRIYMVNEQIDEYEQKLRESCPDYMAKVGERDIYLMVRNTDDFDKAKEFIQSVIPEGATIYDLKSEISEYDYMFRFIRLMAAAIVIVFALIAVSNIFNITVSGISESRRSYGLLRAVGMTDRQLEKTAAVQTFLPIIYASVITLILTAAAVMIIALNMGDPIDIEKALAFTEPHKALIRVIIASAAAFSVAALAAYFPLMRIEKSTVSDSVRFET